MSIIIPPIKCQGIKSKLVPKILSLSSSISYKRWVEPFMGSGVVAFNLIPDNALLCDVNPYLIEFYNSIKNDVITPDSARCFLTEEGGHLLEEGAEYYYEVRRRFNEKHSPFDFLFLNRSCFNGIMRFNSKGEFNVPFCRKNNRFAPAYITKIVNQISSVSKIIHSKNFEFSCQDFRVTLSKTTFQDFIYCDPPYIDRYADYFSQWSEFEEEDLLNNLKKISGHFILSTWKENEFRQNKYIAKYSQCFNFFTQKHYYHVGGFVDNRHAMEEALFLNYDVDEKKEETQIFEQLCLSI